MRTLLDLDTGADRRSALTLVEDEYGLLVGVTNPGGTRFTVVSDEQALAFEVALYKYRINKIFDNRKEPDADGEPRPGAELEGRASPPPGA